MTSQILRKPLPYLALALAHLIWGANFVVAKVTLIELPIMILAFLRFMLAFLLILPFLLSIPKKSRVMKFKDLPKMVTVGLMMTTFNITLFYEGLLRTSAINASVLTLIIPMVSVLAGWWFLKERIYWINLLGIGLGFLGAVIIIGIPLFFLSSEFSSSNLIGNLLIVASAITFVVGSILSRQLLQTYQPLVVTAATFAVGAVTFLLPAILEHLLSPNWTSSVSILGLLGLLYITILSSVSAYFLLTWGLAKIIVSQANLFQYLEPAIAATLAVYLLNERISFSFIIGTCLVILGVYWGTLGKPEHHHPLHRHHRA